MDKKEKEKEMPAELKVLSGMDVDDLRSYMFPCLPTAPWQEQLFMKELLHGKCYRNEDGDDQLRHIYRVTSQLSDSISDECSNGKFQNPCDIYVCKSIPLRTLKALLFPYNKIKYSYLVRRNGRQKVFANNLRLSGKYVMFCCVVVPLEWNSLTRKLASACHEFYSKLNSQFEMVIVAMMRDGWTQDKKAFRQFLSAFPSDCLAVPFHAKSHRHRICKFLGGMDMIKVTLVAPCGTVMLHQEISRYSDLIFVPLCHLANSHPFPFLTTDLYSTNPLLAGDLFSTNSSSLEDFLCCTTSDSVFRKVLLGSETFVKEKVSVLQLKSKLVGLYLYRSGHLLPLVHKVEEACRQSNKELEIVIVYLPDWCIDPKLYPEVFSTVLAKQNLPWWVAPYNNSASIMLKHRFEGEKLITVGPHGLYVDFYGAELMQIYGSYAYPFTVKCVIEKTLKELRKVTLESFLNLLDMRFVYSEPHHVGKNVLFYFDFPWEVDPTIYDAYVRFISDKDVAIFPVSLDNDIKLEGDDSDDSDDSEVRGELLWNKNCTDNVVEKDYVILPCSQSNATLVAKTKRQDSRESIDKLSWHNCPNVGKEFFRKFFNRAFPTIVAFGEDGRICSLLAHRLPCSDGAKAFPVKGDLLEEVSFIFDEYLSDYDESESRYNPNQSQFEELQAMRQSWLW